MSLSTFLRDSKQRYLAVLDNGTAKEWTVVMGNEAADLDSISSSIAYAWFASNVIGTPHIALVQSPRSDLKLRPENLYAFTLASLTPNQDELLCLDEVPLSSPSAPFPSNKFALVDHNRLKPLFTESNPSASVVAVIDHHNDEGLYNDTANPRIIQVPTGSCTSLVALHMTKASDHRLEIHPEVATLLLSGIIIDTNGFEVGGKAVQADREAAAFLIPHSSLASSGKLKLEGKPLHLEPSVRDLADELTYRKSAVQNLSTAELLRRDYKQYTIPSSWASEHKEVIVGLATVPLSLQFLLARGASDFWDEVDSFVDQSGLDVLGILTTFLSAEGDHSGKMVSRRTEAKVSGRRQTLFVVRELAEGGLENRLWAGIEGSTECKFDPWPLEQYSLASAPGGGVGERLTRAYDQVDPKQTRKVVAPVVWKIIEGNPV